MTKLFSYEDDLHLAKLDKKFEELDEKIHGKILVQKPPGSYIYVYRETGPREVVIDLHEVVDKNTECLYPIVSAGNFWVTNGFNREERSFRSLVWILYKEDVVGIRYNKYLECFLMYDPETGSASEPIKM